MMSRLLKCTCGTTPKRYPQDFEDAEKDELKSIICPNCDLSTLSWCTQRLANLNWNGLIKNKRAQE